MSVLSVAEARALMPGSPLTDAALQLAIDDIEAEIVDRFGPYYPASVELRMYAGFDQGVLILPRKAISIVSVVEELAAAGTPIPTRTLSTDDYRLRGSYLLERRADGGYPARAWSRATTVVFIPRDDTARRKMVTAQAVKAETSYTGVSGSVRIGDYSESSGTASGADGVVESRKKILGRLRTRPVVR